MDVAIEEADPEVPPERPLRRPQAPARNVVDLLLRRPDTLMGALGGAEGARTLAKLALLSLGGHLAYGLVVASFSQGMQWWAAPLKIVLGTALCGAICFPSLYIFLCLSGADVRLSQVLALLVGTSASTAIFLAGFAPVTWVFSTSSTLVPFLGTIHLLAWAVSLFVSQRVIQSGLASLGARSTGVLGLWALILFATSLQMMTVLRPIVGSSERFHDPERKFFLQHWSETIEAAGGKL